MIPRISFQALLLATLVFLSSQCATMDPGVLPGALTLMEGKINGKGARLVVDSGSPSTLIAKERARKYGVTMGSQSGMSGGIGGLVPRHSGMIDSWAFAGRRGGPTFIQVQTMPFADEQGGPDGLAGLDILETLGVVVDYSKRLGHGELIVDLDGEGSRQLARHARAEGWTVVSLIRQNDESYHLIPVKINGVERLWLLDTGAQRGLIEADFARSIDLQGRETTNRIIGATGHLNQAREVQGVTLELPGNHRLIVSLVELDLAELGSEPPNAIRYGLIGADVLNAMGAIYDIGAATLFLPPSSEAN